MDRNKIAKDNGTDRNPSPFGFSMAPTHANRVDIVAGRGQWAKCADLKDTAYPVLCGDIMNWSNPS